jgi:hypothetical protein
MLLGVEELVESASCRGHFVIVEVIDTTFLAQESIFFLFY